LDILRRNVLDETPVLGVWTLGERVDFDPLVTMAVRHIDSLKDQGFKKLPWQMELFGRAHFTMDLVMQLDRDGTITVALQPGLTRKFPLLQMRWGYPVPRYNPYIVVVTAWLGALLLYEDGACVRLRPWHQCRALFKQLPPRPIPEDGIGRFGGVPVF